MMVPSYLHQWKAAFRRLAADVPQWQRAFGKLPLTKALNVTEWENFESQADEARNLGLQELILNDPLFLDCITCLFGLLSSLVCWLEAIATRLEVIAIRLAAWSWHPGDVPF